MLDCSRASVHFTSICHANLKQANEEHNSQHQLRSVRKNSVRVLLLRGEPQLEITLIVPWPKRVSINEGDMHGSIIIYIKLNSCMVTLGLLHTHHHA